MKITESQLRQLIRAELKNVLKEAEEQPVITFAKLKNADIETKRDRGTYQDSEGKRYPAKSPFENMSVHKDKIVPIKKNELGRYIATLNPDGDGELEYVIEPETARKLGLEVKQKQSRPAGLPPKGPEMDAFRAQISELKKSIKKQIAKILKEQMTTFSPQQAFNVLLKEYASYVPLFKEQPNNIESLKNSLKDLLQKTPQSGIKQVIRVEAPTIQNGMIYGSFVEFIAIDGKKYKFNYAPSVSTLVDKQTSQIIYRN